ncbi:ferredoxin [Dactylosporangium sucinum]|uniref:Ferredoxin FdxD n=1 Tax=Dactylosporangium sucinum TaxID=1424081 RepID=A0A917WQ76_9ACTN|nr:ferredoxin [Dactylosporangium sucinum]GGM20737.1 ferredoxin FdxD [Dactylosporangium sucinum]
MTVDNGDLTVEVDRVACEGHALCLVYAAEVFDMDDEERAVVLVDPVPGSLRGAVEDAASNCPVQAIRLHAQSAASA